MYNNILETIGNTPLVKINKLNPNPNVSLYAKLEGFNPTGSIKDRIALKMIEQAELKGCLTKDKIIIEATSGNTGIGIAMIGRVKGYKVQIVMSEAVSVERQKMIKSFGGEIILTAPELGTDGAIMKTREIISKEPSKYFNPNQFSNEYNKIAHYKTTAEEIWEQTEGKVTHFVSSLGTSGTLMGVGKGLKEKNPNIQVIEAQPVKGHYIQGLKNMEEAVVPEIYDPSQIDHSILIESEEAFEMARRIVAEEGIFVGMSSGAAMLAAVKVVESLESGLVVVIFPDRGEKYLSTNLFDKKDDYMIYELLKGNKLNEILKDENNFAPFALYQDRDTWNTLSDPVKDYFNKNAQNLKNKTHPILPATLYLDFARTGDRANYDALYFPRRADLLALTIAECIEGNKEYIDAIINLVWAICEETSWVSPAHNNKGELPDMEYETFIDLFSAETASVMAWTYYFLGDVIAETSPLVKRRMEIEIDKRIITPYLKYSHFWYMGLDNDDPVNNWNPWINSNVLVVFAIFAKDKEQLIKGIEKTARSTDSFIKSYNDDGACDEGPGYFGAAGAALFDYLETLDDITGGKISIYDNELLKNMARYIYRVYIGGNYYVNYADGSCRPGAPAKLLARVGEAIGDDKLIDFANYILSENSQRDNFSMGFTHVSRSLKSMFQKEYPANPFTPPRVHWFDGTEILTARDTEDIKNGMFISAKGGHNDESHNHNDIGNFIVYMDGKPVIIDVGVETYTKKTFSRERYTIWTMQSCYHNLPTINGQNQVNGGKYHATDVKYNHGNNITTLSMQLKTAYPEEANIESYEREFVFAHGKSFIVRDSYKLSQAAEPFVSNIVCFNKPIITGDRTIQLSEDLVLTFDDENFEIFIDEIELMDSRIRNDWRQDYLYRIRLAAKELKKEGGIEICINKK